MSESANPDSGVHDVESAVEFLIQAEEPKEEETQETAQAEEESAEETGDTEEVEAEASEEDAEDTGDDAEADAEDEDEEPEDEPRYTVKVNGEEFEVTLEELQSGYQKNADYHRKTAAVAEERRTLESERQQVQQLRSQLTDALDRFAAQGEEEAPDWVKLAKELDPWEYQTRRAEFDRMQQAKGVAKQRAEAMRAEDHQKALAQQTAMLVESFPEWRGKDGQLDMKRIEADRMALLGAAQVYGFTPDEYLGAMDHRVFKMLADARKWQEYNKAKPAPEKRVAKKPVKAIRPGVQKSRTQAKSDNDAALRGNMRKRGSVDSAVEWLLGG